MSSLLRRGFVFVSALSLLALEALGQTSASQGTSPNSTRLEFDSPMLVEFPVSLLDASYARGAGAPVQGEYAKYTCEGVNLQALRISTRRNGNELRAKLFVVTCNRPGHDKWASFRFDLLQAGAVLTTGLLARLDVEENKCQTGELTLKLPVESIGGEQPLTMRLKVTTSNNEH